MGELPRRPPVGALGLDIVSSHTWRTARPIFVFSWAAKSKGPAWPLSKTVLLDLLRENPGPFRRFPGVNAVLPSTYGSRQRRVSAGVVQGKKML